MDNGKQLQAINQQIEWLKSISFKLPIIEEDTSIGLDNGEHVETLVLLSKVAPTK